MKRPINIILAFGLLLTSAWAEELPPPSAGHDKDTTTLFGRPMPEFPKTLLYTADESERIEKAVADLPKNFVDESGKPKVLQEAPKEEPRPNVYLSALVYSSSSDWSAWINGIRFRPGTVQNGIRPVKATARWIELDVDTNEGPTIRVRLAPNQTYLAKDDRVVDGIFQ